MKTNSYNPIDKLLSDYGLEPADDFQQVMNLTWSVQQHRSLNENSDLSPDENCSRTSLFFACAELQPEMQDLLKTAGLDYEAYRRLAGVEDFTSEKQADIYTIPVSEAMAQGLKAYADALPERPQVGAWELAWAIAAVGGGSFHERFASSKGNLDEAAELIFDRIQKDGVSAFSDEIDLTPFELQKHVNGAFQTALTLSGGESINAMHMLQAAVVVEKTASSKAFAKLTTLLNLSASDAKPTESTHVGLLPVNEHVKKSFSNAKPFLKERPFWGRDYITLALLSVDDPSLIDIGLESGKKLKEIRDEWFRFLASETTHRNVDSWRAWYRAAGMTPPQLETTEKKPDTRTLLFTWNPVHFKFEKFASSAKDVKKQKGEVIMGWSTGSTTKSISIGDRVFLMRQGVKPKGIVGSGWVAGEVHKASHFDDDRREKGDKFNRVEVRWDSLGEHPIISRDELLKIGPKKIWDSSAGGIEVDETVAEKLEAALKQALESSGEPPADKFVAPRAFVDTDAIPPQARTRDFKPSEHDSLEVGDQAKIFSALLVSQEVKPPFALGLFGDWGVGKSFFMRLMQEHVENIAGKQASAEHNLESVTRAAQIEFNAWHYVDSDLWASLASHIFDELSNELSPTDKETDIEKERRKLRQLIDSSQREKTEANAAIETAMVSRQKATRDLKLKERERQLDAGEYFQIVWNAVIKVPEMMELKNKSEQIAKRFGVEEAIDGVENAKKVYASLRDISRRTAGLSAAFVQEFKGWRALLSVSVVLGLIILLVSWPKFISFFVDKDTTKEFATMFLTPVLRLSTIVGPSALWALTRTKQLSIALGSLEQVQKKINEPRERSEDPNDPENKLLTKIERLDAEIAAEQRQIEEADRQISAAQAEIQRIDSGGLVYDFLEGRVRDSRYLDRLGLISVIRRDFEELGVLLKDWTEHGISSETESKPKPIERIILYIDDLDRCPPKRVVEVLQAVHLILAFDLFVVVVAVDARWLERSLNEVYNEMPKAISDSNNQTYSFHEFSAHNYLEKIFQIPYSIPRMDEDGFQKLVKDMIGEPQRRALAAQKNQLLPETKPQPEKKPKPDQIGQLEGVDDKQAATVPKTPDPDPKSGAEEQRKRQNQERNREVQKQAELTKQEEERRQKEHDAAAERVKAMLLNESEQNFISALHCFIATPRLAKRFVNIYRLIRVRAAEMERGFEAFIDPDQGDYRAVLMLLAICVGRSKDAPKLISALEDANEGTFQTWLFKKKSSFETVNQNVSDVVAALKKVKGPGLEQRLKPYRDWARDVGRFSFHWRLNADD